MTRSTRRIIRQNGFESCIEAPMDPVFDVFPRYLPSDSCVSGVGVSGKISNFGFEEFLRQCLRFRFVHSGYTDAFPRCRKSTSFLEPKTRFSCAVAFGDSPRNLGRLKTSLRSEPEWVLGAWMRRADWKRASRPRALNEKSPNFPELHSGSREQYPVKI